MKKLLIAAAICGFSFAATSASITPACFENVITDPEWMKSKDGTWMGANNTWYKLNTKDASLWMSKDGKKWDAAKDGKWQDKDGKWLKIVDKQLKWSADGGKTWADVPEWKWMGHDGKWYSFDKDWTLWVTKSA